MQIQAYLNEMEHAVQHVLSEVYRERDEAERLAAEVKKHVAAIEDGYRRAQSIAMNPELDDEGLGTAIHWDTYFGPDKERHYKQIDLDETNQRIAAREFSTAALSGNVLQYAKQGIALRFGSQRNGIDDGRLIGGLALHEVIWQGRNQALHWEDGQFSQSVDNCFQQLSANVNQVLADYRQRNMAFDVIKALGWREFSDFERDMLSLEP